MATALTGSLYLTNNVRSVLGLNSVEPAHRVKDKAEAWAAKKGRMIYIQGLGEIGGTPPEPPEPTATIGKVTITGPGLSGDAAAWTTGDEHELTAAIDGDASDTVYVWSVRSGDAIGFVGVNAGKTVHVSCEKAGAATLRCLATATASDSPQEKTLSIVVTDPAKQTKNTKK